MICDTKWEGGAGSRHEDTAGSPRWGPVSSMGQGVLPAVPTAAPRTELTVHVPQTLAAADRTHPRCVGGPCPCPCCDTASTRPASPSTDGQTASAQLQALSACLFFYHLRRPTYHAALGFELTNNCSPMKRSQVSVPLLLPLLSKKKKSEKKSYKNGLLSHLARLRLYVIANWV